MRKMRDARCFVNAFLSRFPDVQGVYLATDDEADGDSNCTVEIEWPLGTILAKYFVGGDEDVAHHMLLGIEDILREKGVKIICRDTHQEM